MNSAFARDLLITLVVPSVIGKTAIFYFGSQYSAHPGEGWGYALFFAVFITVFNLARFIWKYRDYSDE